jgi:predicted alpha/beta hydrolase family esterase
MKQIIYIHGGNTHKTKEEYINYLKRKEITLDKKRWHGKFLKTSLPDYQIIKPRMPCSDNSNYEEWKITFERYFEFIEDNVILIGGSLGGIFLAKYLSENKFPKKIKHTYLVCPPYDDSLPTESLVGGFVLKDISSIDSENLTLMFSKDDDVVPVSHADKYKDKLKKAKIIIYESKNGHFQIEEFPEIVEMIKG